jgi:hypothetical protein
VAPVNDRPASPVQDEVPYLVPRKGKADVGGFFAALAGIDFHGFEPVNLLAGGNQVAAVFKLDVTVKATGRRFQDLEIHLWTFGDAGEVTSMRHVLDTAKHAAAQRP